MADVATDNNATTTTSNQTPDNTALVTNNDADTTTTTTVSSPQQHPQPPQEITPTNQEATNQRQSSTKPAAAPLECLLCTEVVPHSSAHRHCCSQACCQACLYRHITTIWEDALTGGQRPLTCPAGCAHPLSDSEIRVCLHAQHLDLVWEYWGRIVYVCIMAFALFLMGTNPIWTSAAPGSLRSCRHYRLWRYLLHTRAERRDLDRYEQWSVATGLRSLGRTPTTEEEVLIQHCPAPNCDYAWIVANVVHRRSKQAHERRRVFLWYAPPASTSQTGNWVEPDFLHFGPNAPPPPSDWDTPRNDGRRMVCAKCHYVFCGLCRQPWKFARHPHAGRSCRDYARHLPADQELLGNLGVFAEGARQCPGCHTITSRISGCNHMTCPCGRQWCYVCGSNWNTTHYGCVERDDPNPSPCVIL